MNSKFKIKSEVSSHGSAKSHSGAGSEAFGEGFFNAFCSNLDVETFEKGRMEPINAGLLLGPLNEFSSVGKFKPGEILPGISITTISPIPGEKPILGLYGQLVRSSLSKVIYAGTRDHDLLVDFTTTTVKSASLDIISFPYDAEDNSQQVTVVVTYNNNTTHTEEITASISGVFWSITGRETISQIVLSSKNNDAWMGVDNIAFGVCEDNDGDGCIDTKDKYLDSNLELTIRVGGCDSGVVNKMTSVCGVSLSDRYDEVEAKTYDNHGNFAVHLLL